jgi:hypothetical protein
MGYGSVTNLHFPDGVMGRLKVLARTIGQA